MALPCRFRAVRSSLEASSSSLRAFSSRSKAARVALLVGSKTGSRSAIFLPRRAPSRSGPASRHRACGCGAASGPRASRGALPSAPSSPPGAPRPWRELRCCGPRALAKLKLQVLRPLQHLLPVQDVDLLRREPASEPIGNQPLQHGRSPSELIVQAAHLLPRGSPLRLGINGGLQHSLSCSRRSRRVAILIFFTERKKAAASEETTAGTLEKVAPHADL